MGFFAQASHKDLQGFPIQREAEGWVSSHRPATRILLASRYREKLGMGNFAQACDKDLQSFPIEREAVGWVSLHRPATRNFMTSRYREKQGDGYLRICQPQGSLGFPDIERSRGIGIFSQASPKDLQGFPIQGEVVVGISLHRPATKILRASRYREKLGDRYLRIGQPQGSLGLPDIERRRGMRIFAQASHKDLQGFPIQGEEGDG